MKIERTRIHFLSKFLAHVGRTQIRFMREISQGLSWKNKNKTSVWDKKQDPSPWLQGKHPFIKNSNNTVIFISLRAIQYEWRLKYKSAFILQKIDPYQWKVLVNSPRTLSVRVRRLFTRTVSKGSIFCLMNADLHFNLLSYWIARRLINMTVLFLSR